MTAGKKKAKKRSVPKRAKTSLKKRTPFRVGASVKWKWIHNFIQGRVVKVFFDTVEKKIKGSQIKRKGSTSNPAYLVKSSAGNQALKLHTELSKSSAENNKKAKAKPSLFR